MTATIMTGNLQVIDLEALFGKVFGKTALPEPQAERNEPLPGRIMRKLFPGKSGRRSGKPPPSPSG